MNKRCDIIEGSSAQWPFVKRCQDIAMHTVTVEGKPLELCDNHYQNYQEWLERHNSAQTNKDKETKQ